MPRSIKGIFLFEMRVKVTPRSSEVNCHQTVLGVVTPCNHKNLLGQNLKKTKNLLRGIFMKAGKGMHIACCSKIKRQKI